MMVRAPCGGGYGDGGQHEQTLWGVLAHIPGLTVAVPSNPADAGGLITTALSHDGPVVFMEHKLLSETNLEFLGSGGRQTVNYDVPSAGTEGPVPRTWEPVPFGEANEVRSGDFGTLISLGVGVHRSIEAADQRKLSGEEWAVLDLRTVAPLDEEAILNAARKTGRVIVVDEDYRRCGLSGEIAAVISENGINCRFSRVCTNTTIPYARRMEDEVLPSTEEILRVMRRYRPYSL